MAGIPAAHQLLDGAREAFSGWDEELGQKLAAGFLPPCKPCVIPRFTILSPGTLRTVSKEGTGCLCLPISLEKRADFNFA